MTPRSRVDALIAEQEGLARVDRDTIEAIQLKKLNRLLAREKERGGFYRDLPERISSLERLSDLPFTTDEDLAREAGGLLMCSQSRVQRILSDATSGTTGAAKRVFYTEDDLENTVRLYMAGLGELIFPGGVTMICFPFSGPFGLGELIAEAIRRLGARPLCLGSQLSYGEYAAAMEAESPDSFVGMPAQLLGILRVCGRGSLRRALVSGDACPEGVTRACERLLGSRLFPHYGSRETGMAGAICCRAHEGMHLRENHIIAEIVDGSGRVLPRGEWGELVVTTVGMEAMPLIRYRTGDVTRILPGPCPCGSETLRLDTVRRRTDGLSADALDGLLLAADGVADCRYTLRGGTLEIEALLCAGARPGELRALAEQAAPGYEISLRTRAAALSDRALYRAKRGVMTTA